MSTVFDLVTSPFGLPVNPICEYIILAVIGLIAYKVAYALAGYFGTDSYNRKGLHWIIRILIFIVLWAVVRFLCVDYQKQKL